MSNNLTVIEANQKALKSELTNSTLTSYIKSSFREDEGKIKDFRSNLTELAYNTYLMKEVSPKHIIKVAIDLTLQGLNVNPRAGQVSIVPFGVKGVAGKVPAPIIHLKGHQEILFNGNFFLEVDRIWEIDELEIKESEMTFSQLSKIDETDSKFRDKYFLGFYVTVKDLAEVLPAQSKFVSYKYTKVATKNMDTPKEFLLEGLVHKAIRKALKTMCIPHSRVFSLDEGEIVDTEEIKEIKEGKTESPINDFNNLDNDAKEAELITLTEEEILAKLKEAYPKLTKEDKESIMKAFAHKGEDRQDILLALCERLELC